MSQKQTTDNPESNTLNGLLRWMGMTIFVGAILTGTSRRAAAATVTVTNTNDSGAGSLRDAVATAAAGDTIAFNLPNPSVIDLTSQIKIDKPLTITGPGASALTVEKAAGPFNSRVFYVSDDNGGTNNVVNISGLTISGGYNSYGAGILNGEKLTISNCVISGNQSPSVGGGIFSYNDLTIKNSIITGNRSYRNGGGIASFAGSLSISNSTLSDNHATGVYYYSGPFGTYYSGYSGGAISKSGPGKLTLTNSTLSDNSATANGGAILLQNYGYNDNQITACTLSGNIAGGPINGYGGAINVGTTRLTLKNSTVSQNKANGGQGGGLFVSQGYNTHIQNSTIAYNYSTGDGGGIFCNSQTAGLFSTIVSGNSTDSSGPDLRGRFYGTNSLVSNTSGANFYGNRSLYGQSAVLGPLQDNGGPTFTHALLAGSPCFEAGAANNLAVDQRGLPRTSGIKPDIGAFEAQAKSFIVKNLNDSGPDSLRQCVLDANSSVGPDIITFQAGLTGTIGLTTGQININDHTTIQGPGSSVVTVSGSNNSRIFYVGDYNPSAQLKVSISGLTLTGGNAGNGGAIFMQLESLVIRDSVLTGNAASGQGGAIASIRYNNYGTPGGNLEIVNSTISSNTAAGAGGGVYFYGSAYAQMTVTNSTISNNTAGDKGGGIWFYGDYGGSLTIDGSVINGNTTSDKAGGVFFYSDDGGGRLLISNTTISGNTAAGKGGGVYTWGNGDRDYLRFYNSTISGNTANKGGGIFIAFESDYNSANVINSTISGNKSKDTGGGIYIYATGNSNTQNVFNSTIAGNTADSDGDGYGTGGGIYLNSANPLLRNTIVATNTSNATTPVADDINGSVSGSSSFNLVGADNGLSNITNSYNGNLVGTSAAPLDPKLGPLQNNGGPTFTHAIDSTSPAHDAGDPAGRFSPFDQRGTGFRRISDRRVDIGAFEFQDPPLTFVVTNLDDSGPGSLRDCIAAANSAPSADIITFAPGLTGTIALTTSTISITDHTTIVGPGANVITVTAPSDSRIFDVYDFNRYVDSDVSISGLTISGGNARVGGALYSGENLTISDCVLTGNSADFGGAIAMDYGVTLTIRNSTFSNNDAYYAGGAIAAPTYANVLIENCTISGNTTDGNGGGIYFASRSKRVPRRGGYFSITLRNNTITSNSAANGYGGGVFVGYSSGPQPANSPRGRGPIGPTGAFLNSNIIAKNTDLYGAPDIAATVDVSGANNLIGIESGLSGLVDGTNNNQIGTAATPLDPLIGPLQLNGGVLPTHALLLNSPALDKGSNPGVLAGDERGDTFAREAGPQTDIGAFENQLPVVTIGGPYSIKFGDALTVAATATDADNDTLTYTWDINGDGTFGDATGANPTLTAAQLTALGIGTGTFNVTVQVSDGFHSVTASTTLTVVNNTPPVVEPPVVTPTPGIVGNEVTVVVSATDPNGLPLTFLFDWGDGTTSTTNSHVYATPGTYTITVTVSNGSSTTTVTTKVIVALNMKATKLKGVTHFGKPGLDFCHLTTIIPDIKPGFSPAGKTMDVDFGGVKRSFTLDAKGKATTGDSTVRLQLKFKGGKATGGATRLWVNLNKGDFAAAWKDEGLDPAKPLRKATIPFIVMITMDGTTYLGSLKTAANSNATVGQFHTTGFK